MGKTKEKPDTSSPSVEPEKTEADRAADARNSIGGQGPAGAEVPTGVPQKPKQEETETVTAEELAASKQPKAPEKPLFAEPPPTKLESGFDETEAAPEGEQPPGDQVNANEK